MYCRAPEKDQPKFQDLCDVQLTMGSVIKNKSKFLAVLSSKPFHFVCYRSRR